jgi:ABC-type glycerol-3-phosphate transport system substrate-binding protein
MRAAGIAMVALLAMVIAACGGTENTSTTLKRSGTITIWHNWEGGYLDAKKAIFDAYSKQYPDVTITLVHKTDLEKNVTTAVPAGQGPDIIAWVDDPQDLRRHAGLREVVQDEQPGQIWHRLERQERRLFQRAVGVRVRRLVREG